MRKRVLFTFLLLATNCWGQGSYTLPLAKANTALSLPEMAAGGEVLYEAHRSFDVLRFSNRLQVSAFDLATHKELRHVVIKVPRVHGARAAEGFFLSPDGQTLVYAELHQPNLLLVLSAKDLSEVRRTSALPFTSSDSYRLFAGFDGDGLLSFASIRGSHLRFVRMNISNFKITSEVIGPKPNYYNDSIVWSPKGQVAWLESRGDVWREYHEDGSITGEEARYQGRYSATSAALALDTGKLIAFYGNMMDKGAILSYGDDHARELGLPCVPRPYSSGDVADYTGAICTTSPDREPEHGGDKILTSEFLLLKVDGPTIVWRHPMDFLSVADSNAPDTGFQRGDPLLCRVKSKLFIIAPAKKPELTVYEISVQE